jgi:hypothetical protein
VESGELSREVFGARGIGVFCEALFSIGVKYGIRTI